jgi:hypothetical protein
LAWCWVLLNVADQIISDRAANISNLT